MAPRKRTTNKGRKNNPKMAKLEAFLDDFDSEVKTIIERLKERTNSLLKDADNFYNMALIKQPKAVRQMNWIELCDSERANAPVEDAKKEEVAAQVDSVMAEVHTILPKSAKKVVKKHGGVGARSEDEENIPQNQTTLKKGKATRKAPSTSKRAKAISANKLDSSIRKSNRKPLVTPSRNFLDSSLMGPTPLITPRFDSRLPKTPAVRVPRHKEKVYSISVNGSPIAGGSNDIILNIPAGNGQCIQLLASEMDSVDLNQLDDTTLQSIRQLQNRLTTLCAQSK
ncbi:hypothetical protein AAFF_G00196480 [Aldrovandia affinis]|uniref:Borealin n=1 Tax=Aldrovandia affinis TaxID=143900 RepID=A0AAD7RJE9_9TELE|nr:hypothetical protein AAFF_G00196480 [Aldrovandia affinis]